MERGRDGGDRSGRFSRLSWSARGILIFPVDDSRL